MSDPEPDVTESEPDVPEPELDVPEPATDPPPEPGPGGPADRVERGRDDFPIATPDGPRAAQVGEESVPEGITEPEETDEGERQVDPEDDNPA